MHPDESGMAMVSSQGWEAVLQLPVCSRIPSRILGCKNLALPSTPLTKRTIFQGPYRSGSGSGVLRSTSIKPVVVAPLEVNWFNPKSPVPKSGHAADEPSSLQINDMQISQKNKRIRHTVHTTQYLCPCVLVVKVSNTLLFLS
jgi:hypothetical protein